MHRATKLLTACGPALLSLGLACAMDWVFTLEWSFPYCDDQQDGPAFAVYGFPFPYRRFGGVSSLVDVFDPQMYALNLLVRSVLVLWVLRVAVGRLRCERITATRIAMGKIGLALLSGAALIGAGLLGLGVLQPVASLASPAWASYGELRRVGFTTTTQSRCTPSQTGRDTDAARVE